MKVVKLGTHYIFSMGTVAYPLSQFRVGIFTLALGLLTAFVTDWIIDKLGHRSRKINTRQGERRIQVRSAITHSILTAPLWGLGIGWLITWVLQVNSPALLLAGLVTSTCHLFADAISEGRIFFVFKRRSLANFSYGSVLINLSLILLGLVGLIHTAMNLDFTSIWVVT